MNRFILLIFLVTPVFFIGSCKKSGTPAPTTIVQGEWELRMTQASIAPAIDYAPGNGNKLNFTAAGYELYTKGQLVKSGQYLLVSDTFAPCRLEGWKMGTRIVYDNDYSGNKVFVQLSGDKLSFYSGCAEVDGQSLQTYEKLTPLQ